MLVSLGEIVSARLSLEVVSVNSGVDVVRLSVGKASSVLCCSLSVVLRLVVSTVVVAKVESAVLVVGSLLGKRSVLVRSVIVSGLKSIGSSSISVFGSIDGNASVVVFKKGPACLNELH